MDKARHIVFPSAAMMSLLSKAKQWYVDATFKVVRKPFYQLLSIHAFIKKDGALKHIPLCYVLMSHKRKRDYRAVLRAVVDKLPQTPELKKFYLTSRRQCGSFGHVLGDNVKHIGCVFHWTQTVWRKIQEVGLSTAYKKKNALYKYVSFLYIRAFMCSYDCI